MGAFAVSSTLRQTTKKQARPEPRSISGVDAEHSSDVLHGYQSTDTGVSGQDTQNKGSKAAFLITDRQLRTLATRDQGELLPQGSGELPMAEGVLSAHPPPAFSSTRVFYNKGSWEWLAKHSMMVLGGLSEPSLLLVCLCVLRGAPKSQCSETRA